MLYKVLRDFHLFLQETRLKLRMAYWSIFLQSCGSNVRIMENVRINTPINVKLANNIFINHGCEIDASRATIEIGNDVSIGIGTLILSFDHRFDLTETPIRMQGVTAKSVNIKNDVWIGANVTILSGVTISSGAVIGAGAVVTKDVAPYTVVAGVPAKIIRSRLVGKGKRKNA